MVIFLFSSFLLNNWHIAASWYTVDAYIRWATYIIMVDASTLISSDAVCSTRISWPLILVHPRSSTLCPCLYCLHIIWFTGIYTVKAEQCQPTMLLLLSTRLIPPSHHWLINSTQPSSRVYIANSIYQHCSIASSCWTQNDCVICRIVHIAVHARSSRSCNDTTCAALLCQRLHCCCFLHWWSADVKFTFKI